MKGLNIIEYFIYKTFDKSAALNPLQKQTMFICFVFLKYMDYIFYFRIFKYLNEN